MEQKTKITAADGQQELTITRNFDLPVALLFKAYTEPELVAQWMGTKVLMLESKNHGSYRFETTDNKGKIVFEGNGVIHECLPDQKIVRTFEMMNAPFGVQLEFLEFTKLSPDSSLLTIQVLYKSVAQRDQMLSFGFAPGINMAHNRLQKFAEQLK